MSITQLCNEFFVHVARVLQLACAVTMKSLSTTTSGGEADASVPRGFAWARKRSIAALVFGGVAIICTTFTGTAVSISLDGNNPARVVHINPLGVRTSTLSTASQIKEVNARLARLEEHVGSLDRDQRKHLLGGVAKEDFALFSAGANIVTSLTSPTSRNSPYHPGLWPSGPAIALHHTTLPGYCWTFSGRVGHLGIELTEKAFIEEVTIEHVPAILSRDRTSAPRHISVWGLVEGAKNIQRFLTWQERGKLLGQKKHFAIELGNYSNGIQRLLKSSRWAPIASVEYNIDLEPIQSYSVDEDVRHLNIGIKTVLLIFEDNWGHADFTCLYRARIHGRSASS